MTDSNAEADQEELFPEEPEKYRGELRICRKCGQEYYDMDYSDSIYWEHPYAYCSGSDTHCLDCWLGCESESEPDPGNEDQTRDEPGDEAI